MSKNWAGIITIGNELLSGDTVDKNSAWIGKQLMNLGIKVRKRSTVRDTVKDIAEVIKEFDKEYEVTIVSGGLGPTHDDKTMKGASIGLQKELKKSKVAYNWIKNDYEKLHEKEIVNIKNMTEEREKMAYLPENSTPLRNHVGTAPGAKINNIFVLPGVPKEMKEMFKHEVMPKLKEMNIIKEITVKSYAVDVKDESEFAPYLENLEKQNDVEIHSSPRGIGNGIKVVITGKQREVKEAEKNLKSSKISIKKLET